jgi:hypothetical protein
VSGRERLAFVLAKSVPVGVVVLSTLIALLLGELFVRFVVNQGDFLFATLVDHPVLGHRIKPHTTGHDALGFRNLAVPERAGVVAIGDSLTYGIGAARDDSWPQQISILLHESVYNMALGGYGPLEYLYLAQHEAKKLRPRLLIVGFYFGNDLIDAYNTVHRRSYWHSWRETDSEDPGESAYFRLLHAEPKKLFAAVRDWLSRNSVLYSMLRLTLLQGLSFWEQDRMALQATPDRQMIWIDRSKNSTRTIFTPQLRLAALDPGLPSVQQGLRITKRAFSALNTDAVGQGADLLVVLIPTKERVYCRYLKDTGDPMPSTLGRLCDAEERIKEDLGQFLAANAIKYVDVTAAMEEQVRKHVQIYPTDSDAHPRATGYSVIARTVYEAVRRQ